MCTRAKDILRTLSLQVQDRHESIQRTLHRQKTEDYRSVSKCRARIEGTISQRVRAFGLRHASYRGVAKVDLQDVATAAAINVTRLDDWLKATPLA